MQSKKTPHFQIGIVHGYAVMIHREELPTWQQKGFVNSGGRPIVAPVPSNKVWAWGVPETLADTGIERLVGRKVNGFTSSLGSYGMGGCNFWGLYLNPHNDIEYEECLVLPIWEGSRFVRINDSRPTSEKYELLVGSSINGVKVVKRRCDITLQKNGEQNLLTLYLDSPSSEDLYIHQEKYKEGEISDYLIFQDRRGILIT